MEEQWDDFPQSANASSFEEGHAPCKGKGRGAILYENNSNSRVGGSQSYNEKVDDYQQNYDDGDTQNEDCGKRYNGNNNRYGGNNRRQGNDNSRYGSNRGDNGNDRNWQGNRDNRRNRNNDGETENNGYGGNYQNDRRDRPRRDKDDNRGGRDRNDNRGGRDRDDNRGGRDGDDDRGGRGGGYGRNRGGGDDNDDNNEDRGGRRRNGDNFKDDKGEQPKKTEIYIPPEQPDDEKSLFENGVSMGINFDKYDDIEVKVTGENAPRPVRSFDEAGLRSILVENIQKSGYKKPTPVQKYAIPIVMSGRDLMACAQTGSGKTAAFVVPIIHTLLEKPKDLFKGNSSEPQVIIVSPTRELTRQIYEQAKKFSLGSILRVEMAYGGTSCSYQTNKILQGCHILVATPGRLLDFIGRDKIKLSSLRFLVLDEADRMLDMGFLPDIEKIVDHETMAPAEERQTLMFSATFPSEIQELAGRFLNNYLFLAVGIVGGACADVEQNFYQASGQSEKRKLLKELMEKQNQMGSLEGTLVFVEQKRHTDFIAAFLSESNFPTTSIHGDRLQREREEALADFKRGKMSILVATAVAARGLDIKNVAHVINFDMPKTIDEYVHRIGRTGRVGNRGKATSFFDTNTDMPITDDLVKILKQARQPVPDWLTSGGDGGNYSGRARKFGGEDIRGSNNAYDYDVIGSAPPVQQEPEETW